MTKPNDDSVRERAYQLWEKEGPLWGGTSITG